MSRWLSRFAVWTADDTTIVLWMLVVLGVACVVKPRARPPFAVMGTRQQVVDQPLIRFR